MARPLVDQFVDHLVIEGPTRTFSETEWADGAIAFTSNEYFQSLTGAVSFSGALATSKVTAQSLTGGLSFSGNLATRRAALGLTAALSFAGSLTTVRRYERAFTAVVSFSGNLNRAMTKSLTGVLSFSGSIATELLKWLENQLRAIPFVVSILQFAEFAKVAHYNEFAKIRVVGPAEVSYKRGTDILFESTFTDDSGVLYSPDAGTIKMYVKKPDGTYLTGYDRATGGKAMTLQSVGTYRTDLQLAITDPIGRYEVETEGKVGSKTYLDSIYVQVKA